VTTLDDIYKAIDGVRTKDLAGRLAVRATGVAAKGVKALTDDSLGFYDITNDVSTGGFGGHMIVPAKFENEPELFYGPFAQLGTYLGIENPVARFVVDAVFDPLNLVTVGTGALLNRVGKLAHVATGAIAAAETAGKTVKTIDNVLDGLETGIHLATQSPEYLGKLRAAATGKVSRKAWKSLIDEGMAGETTEAGKELLGILRKNRTAMKDIYALAKAHGDDLVGDSLRVQPTLGGRLLAGQVNPLIRIERPFARTRQSLTAQGFIGENSIFAVKQGDVFLWTPVSDSFVLGGGKIAEAVVAKTGIQKGLSAFAEKVTPQSVAIESVQDAGLFRVEADLERLIGNAKVTKDQLSVLLGSLKPRTQDDLLRQLESATNEDIIEIARAYGLDPKKTDLEDLHVWALDKLASASELDDIKALDAASVRQQELLDAVNSGAARGYSPDEALNDTLNAAARPGLREILRIRDLRAMAQDPAGLGNALHARQGMLAVVGHGFTSMLADVVNAATRRTTPKIAGGRKLERAYRESLRFFREFPELWVKEGDDAYKLSTEALAKARAGDDAGRLALFERHLARAAENGINMEEVLTRQGFRDGMSEVVDMLVDLDDAMLTEASRLGLHSEYVKNHFRRLVRPGKRGPRKALGRETLQTTVGGKEAEDIEGLIQDAIDKAIELDPSLARGKGKESVQKLRTATEAQLVKAEEFGFLEFEWDSLASMSDQFAGHQRAVLARQFTDELAFNVPVIDKAMLETMNRHSDLKNVPDFLKGVQPHLDSGLVTGKIPNVAKARMVENEAGELVRQEPWEFMDSFGFKENQEKAFKSFYDLVEVKGGIDVGDDFDAIKRGVLRGSAEDKAFVRGAAQKSLLEDLHQSPAFAKEMGLERKGGKVLTDEQLTAIMAGGSVPKGIREPKAVKKRVAKELEKRAESFRAGLLADATPGARRAEQVWVLKPASGHLKDALNLWDKHGFGTKEGIGTLTRFWRDWNHRLKAWKLNLSPFHFNVVSFTGLLIDPLASARLLKDPLLKGYRQNLLKHQGLGAVGGAVAGGALGDDEESALFGGVVGLVYGTAIGAAMKQSKLAKNFLFEPEMAQYAARAGSAGWHGRPNDRSIGVVAQMMTRMSDGLKRKHGQTLATRMLDGVVGVQLDFEKQMWDVAHNGHKMHAFAALAQQNDALLLKEVDKGLFKMGSPEYLVKQRELDRASMQLANSALGGFQASKLFNDPGWQRRAQDVLMSPDWTVGNVLGAGNIFLNQSVWKNAAQGAAIGTAAELAANGFDVGEITGFGAVGGGLTAVTLGGLAKRSMARIMVGEAGGNQARAQSLKLYRNAILGGYFFGNLVNHMNTGHWMWENPDGKKLSIAQPGGKYYVTLGKPYTETIEFAGADRHSAPFPALSRISTKISPLGQLTVQALTQKTGLGRPLIMADSTVLEGAGSVGGWIFDTVTPISLGRPIAAAVGALTGTERDPAARFAASAISAAGFAVSQKQGGGLDSFLSGAIGATQGLGVDLSALQRPGLGDLSTRNPTIGQVNLR